MVDQNIGICRIVLEFRRQIPIMRYLLIGGISGMIRECETCGESFSRVPSAVKQSGGRYCSTACWYGRKKDDEARFWVKVAKSDGCWTWTAGRHEYGYGVFGDRNHKVIYAHRYSYELAFGSIPDGLFVLHKCDNPPCVRPDHLFLGTHDDNMEDSAKKGRKKGERACYVKLTEPQVQLIRQRFDSGLESCGQIANDFPVGKSQVWLIGRRKLWSHLP